MLMASQSFSQYKYTVSIGANHERQFAASGMHIRLYYNLHEHIHFLAGYSYYFEDVEKSEVESITYEIRSIDVNFNYIIFLGKRFGIYPILGFNYSFGSEIIVNDDARFENFKESLGMNAGFGASYEMGRFRPYIESTSVITVQSFLIYSAGLSYSFGKTE